MRKPLAVLIVAAFVLLTLPIRELAAAGPGTGALAGHIYDDDMRTPVRNAVVMLRNVATQKEYQSEPTDPDGMYRIPGIEEGRYVMGVKAPSGSYNFHYSLLIKSDALAKLSVAMKPGGEPVMLQQGYDANKKKSLGDFFKSPAGIVTILAAVEITLFALVLAQDEASPIID
ncbi:MAG: carboxypeptidase regulatory-like domain-containing protein [Candidatus Aminicenantes bacterium]|nr:carboxypeptidase regulatory-like domain-containing protein [Candidatus Aminicenantes bacterium]